MKKIISLLTLFFMLVGFSFTAKAENTNTENIRSVACIFAGREKYLSILMPYLKRLQDDGKLTEIHFWQFTNRKDDITYLNSLSNLHKTSKNFTEYREITPKITDNSISLYIKARNDAHILINDRYEIVLGGWSNTKSVIRDGIQNSSICEANTAILDENNFKNFNISIKNNTLKVQNLMGVKIDEDEINSVKIHTGYGSEGYWDYEETKNKNIKLFDTEERIGAWHWGEAYSYYLNYDFDLFLKIDDDIVYMDLERYDEFVEFLLNNPYVNCVFPNMVNHAVSVFYNNKAGLIPTEILNKEYQNRIFPDEIYCYYTDGAGAVKVHEYFLDNISKFTSNKMVPISLDGHKESICMFGILKKNFNRIFNSSLKNKIITEFYGNSFKTSLENFDDEVYVYNQEHNFLYPRFTVMHYQFGPQMKNGLDERFLSKYKELSKNIK